MSIPLLDSFLDLFRRKREEIPIETSASIPAGQSITLSPDMKTLYLIENARVRIFDLQSKLGLDISGADGRLSVRKAAQDIAEPPEVPDPPISDRPEIPIEPGEDVLRVFRRPSKLSLSLPTDKYKWNFLFTREKNVLSIIGASDIDFSIIGASDIDFSIIGASDIDFSIIGASDIDFSLARAATPPAEDEPAEEPAEEAAAEKATDKAKCFIFSYDLVRNPINMKFMDGRLIIIWDRILHG